VIDTRLDEGTDGDPVSVLVGKSTAPRRPSGATIGAMSLLLPEQEELLVTLVEAARNVPRPQQQFVLYVDSGPDQIAGTRAAIVGEPLEGELAVLEGDVQALFNAGLLDRGTMIWGEPTQPFTISAAGFAHYEEMRQRPADPGVAIEEETRRYLDGTFKDRFPEAYARLAAAEQMLWKADAADNYTTIGHKLREATQQFATEMVQRHQVADAQPDPAKTKNRLRAVVESQRDRLGTARSDLLKALAEYQDAVNDLVQRQEHGDQKPGEALTWEDARAAVFHTALLLYEYDRLLNQ
jgi:hypothetical protein